MDLQPLRDIADRGGLGVALVRHGRTAWNRHRRFLGTTDIPLDEVGLAQAAHLATAIASELDRVYTSPLSRAAQTASHLGDDPIVLDGLAELRQGELEGLSGSDAIAQYPSFFDDWNRDPTDVRVPGGETMGECRDRAWLALSEVARREPLGAVIGVVAHQVIVASLVCTVLGEPLAQWRKYTVGNTSVTLLEWSGESWSMVAHDLRSDPLPG